MSFFGDPDYSNGVVERLEAVVAEFVAQQPDAAAPAASPAAATLDRWEQGVCLSGYSVAFHALKPVLLARALARAPRDSTAEATAQLVEAVDGVARRRVLDLLRAAAPPPPPAAAPAPSPAPARKKKAPTRQRPAPPKKPQPAKKARKAPAAPPVDDDETRPPSPPTTRPPAPAPARPPAPKKASKKPAARLPGDPADLDARVGGVVYKSFRDPDSGESALFCGKIVERGADEGGEYVNVTYEDGDSESMSLEACIQLIRDQRKRGTKAQKRKAPKKA